MMDDRLDKLRLLVETLATAGSKHDRAIIVISEAIRLGIDTGPQIVAALHELEFNKQHIGLWLDGATGSNPQRHHWHRDDSGIYRNHQ